MRLAVVLAPSVPVIEGSKAHAERVAWLGDALARAGYRVALVRGGGDLASGFARALAGIEPSDTVLVHLSGALAEGAHLLVSDEAAYALAPLADVIASKRPGRVMLIAELFSDDAGVDPIAAAGRVDEVAKALGAGKRGYGAAIALREATADSIDARFAFTKALLASAAPGARLETALEGARTAGALSAAAKSFAFLRSKTELVLVADAVAARAAHEPPAFEPLMQLAESALAKGKIEQSLAALAAARMVVDARNDEARARLCVRTGAALRASGQTRAAEASFDEALSFVPSHRPALDALIAMATEARDFKRAIELRTRRLEAFATPAEQLDEIVAMVPTIVVELEDLERAAGMLERARGIDPQRADVLETLRRVYEALGRWDAMLGVMDAIAESVESSAARAAMRRSQAEIAKSRLFDEARATAFAEQALADDPADAEGLSRIAERHLARGDEASAVAKLESLAARAPDRVATYARLFALHVAAGRDDRAFLTALALEELNAVEMDHEVFIDQYRAPGALRARASFDDAAWEELRAPGFDRELSAVYEAVARAAILAKVDELRGKNELVPFDATKRQEPTSTAAIVRTMYWAGTVLSAPCPTLYVAEDMRGIVPAPSGAGATWLGHDVMHGISTKELAFLAGRHLAMCRPEHRVALHYTTPQDLNAVLLAATQLGVADAQIPPNVASLRARIGRHLSNDERSAIGVATMRLAERGGHVDTAAHLRAVLLTATRAGLFLCGDLASATARLRIEAHRGRVVSLEDERLDLIAFCASEAHSELRRKFGFTSAPSVRPPPPPPSAEALG